MNTKRKIDWPVVIEVPLSVPSGNAYRQGGACHNPKAYKGLREQWCWGITIKLGAPKLHRLQKWVEQNRPKMRVQFTCYRKRRIEQDNLNAGLKPVRDRDLSRRNRICDGARRSDLHSHDVWVR